MERICKSSVFKDDYVSFPVDAPRAQETRSSHGIPPLSAYFVMRKKPMNAIVKGLVDGDTSTQRIMVISGLGGSGKTQLALKFARDFHERYENLK
jgi:Mrp family chromosome partitioning ATPase